MRNKKRKEKKSGEATILDGSPLATIKKAGPARFQSSSLQLLLKNKNKNNKREGLEGLELAGSATLIDPSYIRMDSHGEGNATNTGPLRPARILVRSNRKHGKHHF
jgi:hypothetical protein